MLVGLHLQALVGLVLSAGGEEEQLLRWEMILQQASCQKTRCVALPRWPGSPADV